MKIQTEKIKHQKKTWKLLQKWEISGEKNSSETKKNLSRLFQKEDDSSKRDEFAHSLIYCIYEIENIIILRKAIPLTTEVNIARVSEYNTHWYLRMNMYNYM